MQRNRDLVRVARIQSINRQREYRPGVADAADGADVAAVRQSCDRIPDIDRLGYRTGFGCDAELGSRQLTDAASTEVDEIDERRNAGLVCEHYYVARRGLGGRRPKRQRGGIAATATTGCQSHARHRYD